MSKIDERRCLVRDHERRGDGRGADDEEDVEDCRADDGAEPDVGLGDEDSDEGSEEFGGTASSRHERRSSNIVRQVQKLGNALQRRHKVLVTHNRKLGTRQKMMRHDET